MRKVLALGLILIFFGASITSNVSGNINESKNIGRQFNKLGSTEVTIPDWSKDVWTQDMHTGEIIIVTNSTSIEVNNLDLIQATYAQQGLLVVLSLQVAGIIENRGSGLGVFDSVYYNFQLRTTGQDYWVWYRNQSGQLSYHNVSINLTSSNFSIVGGTLTITFSLLSADEIYKNLDVSAAYINANFSDPEHYVIINDIAPNPLLKKAIFIGFIRNVTKTNDYITFNPTHMTAVWLSPLRVNRNSSGRVMISKNYFGYIGHWIIIGMFKVDPMFTKDIPEYTTVNRFLHEPRFH